MSTIGANIVKFLLKILFVMVHTDAFSCPIEENFILGFDQSCCKPIQCLENQGYKLCSNTDSLGYDTCYDCPPGTINRETPVNTAKLRLEVNFCSEINCDCLPEAELQNREECEKTGDKICVCRRQDRYYGNDPGACNGPINDEIKVKKIRQPGFELKFTGEVDKCELGFFKNKSDSSICIPHTQCPDGYLSVFNGSTTQDRECQRITTTTQPGTTKQLVTTKMLVNTTLQPVTTSKTVVMFTTSTLAGMRAVQEPDTSGDESSTPDPGPVNNEPVKGMDIDWVPIGVAIGFGLLILIVVPVCICCWKKRRKKQSKDIELEEIHVPVEKPAVSCPDINNITNDNEATNMSEKEPLLHVTVDDETVHSEDVDSNDIFVGPDGVIKQFTEEIPNSSNQKTAADLSAKDLGSEAVTGQVVIQCKEPSQQSGVESQLSHDTANLNTAVNTQNFTVCKDESPKVKKITVEKQKSDPTNIIKMSEPCSNSIHIAQMEDPPVIILAPDSSPLDFPSNPQPPLTFPSDPQPPLTFPSDPQSTLSVPSDPQPPHSIGSLRSDEKYSHLSLSSLSGEHVVSPPDSDYGTGSSTKNNSRTIDSLDSSGNYTDLHLSSLRSKEENLGPGQPNKTVVPPQQESQQNINNPKVVAIVSPIRRDEKGTLKTVDEEQTDTKTP